VSKEPLLTAIDAKTEHQLVRSDQITVGKNASIGTPVPAVFKAQSSGNYGYIDYTL
jgi:hypothetical protein